MKLLALFLVFLSFYFDCAAKDFSLLVLHNSDMLGQFEETSDNSRECKDTGKNKSCYGGFARVAHVIREERKKAEKTGEPVLYLNAGNTFVGTVWSAIHKWKIASEFMNLLKPDAMGLGSHEFDYGVSETSQFINAVTFPIVATNLNFSQEPILAKTKVVESLIMEKSGRKIGIVSYLAPSTATITYTGAVTFGNEVECLRKETEKLDKAGVKIILAIGHSEYSSNLIIAEEVPLIDAIFGGSGFRSFYNVSKEELEIYPKVVVQKSGKKVPVVHACAFTKYMGNLSLHFNDQGDVTKMEGKPIFLNNAVPQDQDVLKILEKYRPEVSKARNEIVGRSKVKLDAESCRIKECNFGNLISDAFVAYHASNHNGTFWTDAPIALVHAASIIYNIPKDPPNITKANLIEVMSFNYQVIALNINGTTLLKILEASVCDNVFTEKGQFLQVSGLHVVYDPSQPAGSRVVDVQTRCANCYVPLYQPLAMNQTYRILIPDLMAIGRQGYDFLKFENAGRRAEYKKSTDIVAWFITKRSPVVPEEEGRILFEYGKKKKAHTSSAIGTIYIKHGGGEKMNKSSTIASSFVSLLICYWGIRVYNTIF